MQPLVQAMLHRYPFLFIAIAACLGVLLDHVFKTFLGSGESFPFRLRCWGTLAVCLVVVLNAGVIVGRRRKRKTTGFGRISVNGVWLICLSALWHGYCDHRYESAGVLRWIRENDQPAILRGTLDSTVTLRPNPMANLERREAVPQLQSQLTLRVDSARDGGLWRPTSGRLLVFADGDLSDRLPGDRLQVMGQVRRFNAPSNPGEPDLRPMYRRRGLHGKVDTKNADSIQSLTSGPSNLSRLIASVAGRARQTLFRHTDEVTGPLAVALIVGQREFVEPKTRDKLLATGTAHLLSVSGMHLAILVIGVSSLISLVGLRGAAKFTIVILFSMFYVAVTGGRPPVMRAAILVGVLILATGFRRPSQPLNTLAVAALVLIAINPENVFSVGVHLSFLAVVVLMLAGRTITPAGLSAELELKRDAEFDALLDQSSGRLRWLIKAAGRLVVQMAWLSGCVTAVSLPLIWSTFHLISFVSVLTNVAVWFGLVIALPAGVTTVVFAMVHPWLAMLPGVVCHGALAYMWWIIDWAAAIPMGHLWLPAPPIVAVILYYLVLLCSLMDRTRRGRWIRLGWFTVWCLAATVTATRPSPIPPETLEATFIDVGHGTAVVIRNDSGAVYLYDCGRLGNALGTSREIDAALWSMGIYRIDAILLSHADADHYNAFGSLCDRFDVRRVILPAGMLSSTDPLLDTVRTAIERHQIELREVSAGDSVSAIGMDLQVMHPPPHGVGGDDNANSMVLRVDHADQSLILPGDLEPPGVTPVTSQPRPFPGGVLMAPHHGSLTLDSAQVLRWARPSVAVVSGGTRAGRPEVAAMLSVTGSEVVTTTNGGAVRIRMHADGRIEVRSWRKSPW